MLGLNTRDITIIRRVDGERLLQRKNSSVEVVNPDPEPAARALLLAGPASVEVNVASQEIVVSLDGAPAGTIVVDLTLSGVSGALSDSQVELTPTTLTGSVTLTATSVGDAVITASTVSQDNVTSAAHNIEVLPASTNPVALPNYSAWLNPKAAWATSAPSAPAGGGGASQKVIIQSEWYGAPDKTRYSLDSTKTTYTGTGPNDRYINATVFRRGLVSGPPRYTCIERGATDPVVGTRQMFKFRMERDECGWANKTNWRTEVLLDGAPFHGPWNRETWVAFAFKFSTTQLQCASQYWFIITQYHDHGGGMTGNPPIDVSLVGGDGNASAAKLTLAVKRYTGKNWPSSNLSADKGSTQVAKKTLVTAPAVDVWHYVVINYRTGCGFSDPNKGNIYGPVGQYADIAENKKPFVRVFYAAGETDPPVEKLHYMGYWGGPFETDHSNVNQIAAGINQRPGYWKHGLYLRPTFPSGLPGGLERGFDTLGLKMWHADLNTGIDAPSVLAAFRAQT
jgi:hypothetical protein